MSRVSSRGDSGGSSRQKAIDFRSLTFQSRHSTGWFAKGDNDNALTACSRRSRARLEGAFPGTGRILEVPEPPGSVVAGCRAR
jgi:hypothetical protein